MINQPLWKPYNINQNSEKTPRNPTQIIVNTNHPHLNNTPQTPPTQKPKKPPSLLPSTTPHTPPQNNRETITLEPENLEVQTPYIAKIPEFSRRTYSGDFFIYIFDLGVFFT